MKHILPYILLCLPYLGVSQSKTFKEVKTLEKEVTCVPGEKLSINGERTFLSLKSWDKDLIQIKVQVVSKNEVKSEAIKDLDKIELIFEKKRKQHIYSNAILLDKPEDKPTSNLKVYLEINAPKHLEIDIRNKFGKLDIRGNFQKINSTSQFSNISIADIFSDLNIHSEYGDIEINGAEGTLHAKADRSNVILKNVKSTMELNIQYGELEMYVVDGEKIQSVNAKFSPLSININQSNQQAISFRCALCEIKSNDKSVFSTIDDHGEDQFATINNGKSKLIISSQIEDIEVQQLENNF